MSAYTDSMVAELSNNAPFDYGKAMIFAERYNVSARSVISKVKSLGLTYTAKPKAEASSAPRVRKADIVTEIAAKVGVAEDAIAGLAKADMAALKALLKAV